ncbi:MAG: HEAT repeat domain-containing protein [Gemmataceae bacterium]
MRGRSANPAEPQYLARNPGWQAAFAIGFCLLNGGCALTWDEVTSRDFRVKNLFKAAEPPLVVLETSTDGDKRAKALAALKEPLANGGTPEEQSKIIEILSNAAMNDRQPLSRLRAIETLGNFLDERAVDSLKEAYYRAGTFNPEIATNIKCQALVALGKHADLRSLDLIIKVLREPPVVGSEMEKQNKMDEKITAARALGSFAQSLSTETLLGILKAETDVALRNAARESLEKITGKELPTDYTAWEEILHDSDAFKKAPNKTFFTDLTRMTGLSR